MEFVLKVYSEYPIYDGSKYVGDVLMTLPPDLAEMVEEDLHYVGLAHPDLKDVVDYCGFDKEILRIGKSLLQMGVVQNSRDYLFLKKGYEITLESHSWVV